MLECLDLSIADLLARIPEDALDQTTIIFMGDNGTPGNISEHFTTDHAKDSVYQGGVNVPLIIADGYTYRRPGEESPWTKGKGRVVSPNRVELALVQTMDIFATAAEIGRRDATSTGVDSVSMVPYLSSASPSPQRDFIFTETRPKDWVPTDTWKCGEPGWDVAIRNATFKLIVKNYGSTSTVDGEEESSELYNLGADPWEQSESTFRKIYFTSLLRTELDLLLGSDACE